MIFFGLYLKSLREEKYTQRELARLLDVSFPYISKLESGLETSPSEKLLYKIAKVFGQHPAQVFMQAGRLPSDLSQWLITKPQIYNALIDNMHSEDSENEIFPSRLKLKEMDFRDFFNKSARIMLLIDPEGGQIIEASKSAQSFYGYDSAAFRKLDLTYLNPLPFEELKRSMEQVKSRFKNVFNMNHIVKNEIKNIIVTSEPVHIYGRTLLHSIIIDTSLLK